MDTATAPRLIVSVAHMGYTHSRIAFTYPAAFPTSDIKASVIADVTHNLRDAGFTDFSITSVNARGTVVIRCARADATRLADHLRAAIN